MLGLMQDWPLTVDRIIDHAARAHPDREVVTRSVEGPIVRTGYARIRERAVQGSHGLRAMGIGPGDRVATLGWNTARHLELWYATMGMGAVCHTLNPRLHPDQLCWIMRHAGDRVVFTDLTFAPVLLAAVKDAPCVERVVILSDEAHRPPEASGAGREVLMYEDWLAAQPTGDAGWGGFEERTAAGLCYTSGTTGDPKGVLYSHRSNVLHTFMTLQTDVIGLSARDSVLMVVPMFHANAWGLAFSAPASGAKLVLPGAKMDGASLHELMETEGVTFSAAVPTVWQGLLAHLDATGATLSTLKKVVIGGSACPESLIRAFHDRYGVEVIHAWGMTETSPLGTLGSPTAEVAALPFDEQVPWRMKQGRVPFGVELKIVDAAGARLPEDGEAQGALRIRGPIVASSYFGREGPVLDAEGYFDTGDVATLDPQGYMAITDRAKDVIKSGGEWISSIAIENLIVAHPKVALAAVIGAPHPKWDERPLLIVQLRPGERSDAAEMLAFLDGKIARWWTPDAVVFTDDLPVGPTGKIDKKRLRARHPTLPEAPAAAGRVATA